MALALNSVSELAYRLRQSRIAGVAFVLALAACIWLVALARADNWEDTQVYEIRPGSSLISLGNRYVRVTGALQPDKVYVTQANVGGLNFSGGRYIPIIVEGTDSPIFVADGNLPQPDASGQVTLVGKMLMGEGAQPPYYIEVGQPPDLALQNLLARMGVILAIGLLASWLLAWWISRKDYALGVAGATPSSAAGQGALWFGSLGAEYGNAVVRHQPVALNKAAGEIKLESPASRPPWSVRIREIRDAKPASIATAYGPLPGARVEFQDERGLLRRGAIAACDPVTHEQLRSLFQHASLK
jgi:hypothetical protein